MRFPNPPGTPQLSYHSAHILPFQDSTHWDISSKAPESGHPGTTALSLSGSLIRWERGDLSLTHLGSGSSLPPFLRNLRLLFKTCLRFSSQSFFLRGGPTAVFRRKCKKEPLVCVGGHLSSVFDLPTSLQIHPPRHWGPGFQFLLGICPENEPVRWCWSWKGTLSC